MNDNQTWMTIEQAAVALGLSVRTVNRHINAGKLQSRLTEGRREVLMDYAAPAVPAGQAAVGAGVFGATQVAAPASGGGGPAAAVLAGETHVNSTSSDAVDYETVLALADNAADKAELAVSAF